MPDRTDKLLFARRWHLPRLVAAAIVCALLWVATPLRLFDVPARDGVQGALWPMVPALFAAFVPSVLGVAAEIPERMAPRPVHLRATVAGVVLLVAFALASSGAGTDAAIAYRNTALLVGLAFVGTWLLPMGAAWAPTVLVPIVMWLVGTRPQGRVEAWSLLLLPGSTAYSALIAAVLITAAVGGYIAMGARSD
ncbi:MAG TPA: hypothetical protein VIU15_23380 [Streptomyces sp.]